MSLEFFEVLENIDSAESRERVMEMFKNNYQFAKLCSIVENLSCYGVGRDTLKRAISYFGVDTLGDLKEVGKCWSTSKLPADIKLLYLLTTLSRVSPTKKYIMIYDIFHRGNDIECKWAYRIIAEPDKVRCLICQ